MLALQGPPTLQVRMNNVIADLISSSVQAPSDPAGTTAVKPASVSGDLFRSTLALRLAPPVPQADADPAPAVTALHALQTKIGAMLAGGASAAQVTDVLAKQLASNVAKTLGTPAADDVREKLQTVFATALAPPGAGGGGPAEQARVLAQRYERVAAIAQTIAQTNNGQQKQFAGTILDAHRAKDNPAPATTTVGTHKNSGLATVRVAQHGARPHDIVPVAAVTPTVLAAAAQLLPGAAAPVVAADVPGPSGKLKVPRSAAISAAPADPAIALGLPLSSLLLPPPAAVNPDVHAAGFRPSVRPANAQPVSAPSPSAHSLSDASAVHAAVPVNAAAVPVHAGADFVTVAPGPASPDGSGPASDASSAGASGANPAAQPLDIRAVLPELAALPSLPGIGAGDGRRVNIGSTAASATGGDTLLGRILTRASLAADARETAAGRGTARGAATAAVPSGAGASKSGAADAGLSSFIQKFETALHAATPSDALRPPPPDVLMPLASSAPAAVPDAVSAAAAAPFAVGRADATAPASPNAAPPAVPVDHSAIADQVLRSAFMRTTEGSSEMRLRLVPESLGDVTVKLVVKAGGVTAHVLAQTPEVRDALVAAQPQLSKSLADAGLKLTAFNVDLAGNGFAGFAQQQRRDETPSGQPSRGANGSLEAGDASDETALEAIPSFGPSSVAQATPGDFNHLA